MVPNPSTGDSKYNISSWQVIQELFVHCVVTSLNKIIIYFSHELSLAALQWFGHLEYDQACVGGRVWRMPLKWMKLHE